MALRGAMMVKGYEGASLDDLLAAMLMSSRPGFYAGLVRRSVCSSKQLN